MNYPAMAIAFSGFIHRSVHIELPYQIPGDLRALLLRQAACSRCLD